MKLLALDHYERVARLYPALLATAPVTVLMFLWAPNESALLKGAVSLTVSAGVLLVLMHYGRLRGRAIQAKMVGRMGGLASTVALRHRDTYLAKGSRTAYHDTLRSHGLDIPTPDEEASDPVGADDKYRSAVDWLREQTRNEKKFPLVHGENRSYGFRRNLLGLKPLGLSLALIALIVDLGLSLRYADQGSTLQITGFVLAGFLAVAVTAWVFVITEKFVLDASWAYTERLLGCLVVLKKPGAGKVSKNK